LPHALSLFSGLPDEVLPGAGWSVGNPDRLSIKSWDDDDVGLIFDAVTGDTHSLDQSAVEILQSLEVLQSRHKAPVSIEQLAHELAVRFSASDQGQISDFITTTLLQLKDIGLVFDAPV
jgi:PqqD family protein of HPr-rel-A system